jgi:hypothetical protein
MGKAPEIRREINRKIYGFVVATFRPVITFEHESSLLFLHIEQFIFGNHLHFILIF